MEKSDGISRRDLLKRSLVVLGAASGAGSLLAACGKDEGGGSLSCNDVSSLTADQQQARTALQYAETTPEAGKTCDSCNFWQAGQANACGGCTLVQGPINPKGYCVSWVAKV